MPKRTRHTFEWQIIHAVNDSENEFVPCFDLSDLLKDFDGWYPIHWAAASKNIRALRAMLSTGIVTLDTEAPNAYSPFEKSPRIILANVCPAILQTLIQEFENNSMIN